MTAVRATCCLACLLLVLALPGCSEDATPEAEIRALIDAGAAAAEARSTDAIAALLHPEFRDHRGNNPQTLRRLVTAWFFRHRNIHLLTRIERIELLSASRAEVALYAAMAGSTIGDASMLARLRAQVYRLDLTLARDDDWRVLRAAWAPAAIADLQ